MPDPIAEAANELDQQIRPTVLETPIVERSIAGRHVWCKQENLQTTGSFKIRGAMAKLLSLDPTQRANGVLTASTGNHGAAVAHAGMVLATAVTVFVPETADPTKLEAITKAGATVRQIPGDPLQAELAARREAAAADLAYVPPYNDRVVVAGQGTVGVELLRQIEDPSTVIVSVGGGGLISGIGAVIKQQWPEVELVAVSPKNSAAMAASIIAGHVIEVESLPTLSDGTAGGVEPDSITFESCQRLIDRWITLTEQDIAEAMVAYLDSHDDRIEGSAAAALAAVHKLPEARDPLVVVLCGRNAGAASESLARDLSADTTADRRC